MTILRVLLFVTLVVRGLDCVPNDLPWNSPMNFHYKDKDVLKLNITLRNVPLAPEAKDYMIFIQLDSCDSNNTEKYMQPGSLCEVPAKKGTVQANEQIYITRELTEPSVILYIYLGNSNKICSRKKIIYGIRDKQYTVGKAFSEGCLNNRDKPCKMFVDFESKCEDTMMDCKQSFRNLTCESTNKDLPEDTVHQWYHHYRDPTNSPIGIIPRVTGKKTKFEMEYQIFDLTTYIYSIQKSKHWTKNLKTEVVEIPFSANVHKRLKGYNVKHSKYYSKRELVIFNCSHNAQTHIGWIDPTGYKIATYHMTSYSQKFEKNDNNSMLCCLHYDISTNRYETTIRRSVDNITVLIYKEPDKQRKASTTHSGDNSQERQTPDSSNGSEPEAPQSTTPQRTTPQTPTPHSAPPQSAPPKSAPPQSTTTHSSTPQRATPQTPTPQSAPPQGAPPQSAPPQSTPPQSAPPESATTQSTTPQRATPQTPTPHSAPPQSAPPQSAPPQSATTQSTTPQRATPQTPTPHSVPPKSAPPQSTTTQSSTPQRATPQTPTPQSAPPQGAPPQSAPPQGAPPQSATPQIDAKLSDNTKYYIAITSVAGIILLISLIYVVIKKCHRKNSDPVQTVQLETYASTDAVLYAELDVTPGNTAPPPREENSNYAVIVGEIRPKNYKK